MSNRTIEAVVFDLDGVITDTAHFHYLAWKALGEELGIEIDEAFNEKLKGVNRLDSLELILKKGNRENDFDMPEKEVLAAKKNEHYCELLKELTPNDILPGIQKLFVQLKEENIKIGLASVSKNAQTVLKALKMGDKFDYCVDAAKIKNGKPHPEIFLKACEGLEIHPSKAIGIEDAVVGVESIQSSGMFAVGVLNSLTRADYVVNDTSELDWTKIKAAFEQD